MARRTPARVKDVLLEHTSRDVKEVRPIRCRLYGSDGDSFLRASIASFFYPLPPPSSLLLPGSAWTWLIK